MKNSGLYINELIAQERERALSQENPNVTDFAKSGSRQGVS